jgi:ribonuclease Z
MTFDLTILGSSAAIPTTTRNLSAHLLNVNERLFLLDCGEGTQLQIRKYKFHLQRIDNIFISHLHGDHYYGLIGLLTTFHLLGRKEGLNLFGPPLLMEIIDLQLKASNTTLFYPLLFHPVVSDSFQLIHEDEKITVHSFPVLHSVPTWGFLFREKKQERKIRKEMIGKLEIPVEDIPAIKRGGDFTDRSGTHYRNELLTLEPPAVRSFAYCADTAYSEKIIPFIKGSNLLYHEATFMQDMAGNAAEKMHSTTIEAATIAKKAGVKKLIIGHFSARYDDLQPLLAEARSIFPETCLAEDGSKFTP